MIQSISGSLRNENKVHGRIRIPASKSHTIRALFVAAFAEGESCLEGPLVSQDTLSCRQTIEALGAAVREDGGNWFVHGFGSIAPGKASTIDVGNSGTSLYLAAALAALSDKRIQFDGDAQIQRRTAAPLLNALRSMGVTVESAPSGCAPFSVTGPLRAATVQIDCPVSQYLSGLLLAAPLIRPAQDGQVTEIRVGVLNEKPYVSLTLDWLKFQGIEWEQDGWSRFRIPAGQQFHSFTRAVPGDWSSSTFFLAAAALTGTAIILDGVDTRDSQGDKAVLDMLASMGCRWEDAPGGVKLEGYPLTGMEFDLNATPDALPAMAAAACFAKGETRLVNVPQARQKETDRISVMTIELRKLGADTEELPDGMIIRGNPSNMRGTAVNSHGDHRVAMALAVAALGCHGTTYIHGAEAVNITFPDFFEALSSCYLS